MVFEAPAAAIKARSVACAAFSLTASGQSFNPLRLLHSLSFRSPTQPGSLVPSAASLPFLP